jgi:hypothetical protein
VTDADFYAELERTIAENGRAAIDGREDNEEQIHGAGFDVETS